MYVLSRSEHDELVEHLEARPDIWKPGEQSGVWVRHTASQRCAICDKPWRLHTEGEEGGALSRITQIETHFVELVHVYQPPEEDYALALRLSNGVHGSMYGLVSMPVNWPRDMVDGYVAWLVEKYTAWRMRQQVVEILLRSVTRSADVELLSRDICELQGGMYTRKHNRRSTD